MCFLGGDVLESDKHSCFECEHYIGSVGENGYCKRFRHETSMPDTACTSFEAKKTENIIPPTDTQTVESKGHEAVKLHNCLISGSFFADTVLMIIVFMFATYFGINLVATPIIPVYFKIIALILSLVVVLLFAELIFRTARRFISACIIEMAVALGVVIMFLVYYDSIWTSMAEIAANSIHFISQFFM